MPSLFSSIFLIIQYNSQKVQNKHSICPVLYSIPLYSLFCCADTHFSIEILYCCLQLHIFSRIIRKLHNTVRCHSLAVNILSLRSEIFGNCILNRTSISKRTDCLHNAFTKCLCSDYLCLIIILHCTGKYLRCTCTIAIY